MNLQTPKNNAVADSVGRSAVKVAPGRESTGIRSETRHGLFWVAMIFALLGGQILLLTSMVYIATSDPSFAVEPDYYQKGLDWDTTSRQLHQNRAMGWTLKISIARNDTLHGEQALTCMLTDRNGRPVDGAIIDLVAFPHSRGNHRFSTNLRELDRGRYAGAMRFHPGGLWEFRFAVRRGDALFTHVVQRNVPRPNRNRRGSVRGVGF